MSPQPIDFQTVAGRLHTLDRLQQADRQMAERHVLTGQELKDQASEGETQVRQVREDQSAEIREKRDRTLRGKRRRGKQKDESEEEPEGTESVVYNANEEKESLDGGGSRIDLQI